MYQGSLYAVDDLKTEMNDIERSKYENSLRFKTLGVIFAATRARHHVVLNLMLRRVTPRQLNAKRESRPVLIHTTTSKLHPLLQDAA
jgi:hypothetical protein